MHDYYRLLAVLENELKQRGVITDSKKQKKLDLLKENAIGTDMALLRNSDNNRQNGTEGLTLLRLKAWMQEPLDRMCLMARLVDSAGPLTGGALASKLHNHARHGDPAVAQLVHQIMLAVCTPFYSILAK